MRNFFGHLIILVSPCLVLGQTNEATAVDPSGEEPLPFLNADFFADSLSEAYTLEEDPMGAQRLLQVRNSTLTPSLVLKSNFLYTDNYFTVSDKQLQTNKSNGDMTSAYSMGLSLDFSIGLGEYGLGDSVVTSPSITLSRGRSFLDPLKDHGTLYSKNSALNTDTLTTKVSFPFVLPNEWLLKFDHTYFSVFKYIKSQDQVMYANAPSFSFEKTFYTGANDSFVFSSGVSYSFSNSPSIEDQFNDPKLVKEGILPELLIRSYLFANPEMSSQDLKNSNTGDQLSHFISLSYQKVISEKISITPSLVYTNINYTEPPNSSRSANSYSIGLSLNYNLFDWLSLAADSLYTKLDTTGSATTTEDESLSFDSFSNGVTLSVNHSF